MGSVAVHPNAAADAICHEDQMVVWSSEFAGALSMGEFVRDDLSYDEVLDLHRTIQQELRRVIESALSHPEAKTFLMRDGDRP